MEDRLHLKTAASERPGSPTPDLANYQRKDDVESCPGLSHGLGRGKALRLAFSGGVRYRNVAAPSLTRSPGPTHRWFSAYFQRVQDSRTAWPGYTDHAPDTIHLNQHTCARSLHAVYTQSARSLHAVCTQSTQIYTNLHKSTQIYISGRFTKQAVRKAKRSL